MGPGEVIPIVAILMTFGIPFVLILTNHQRKMAELIHGKQQDQNSIMPLLEEMRHMRTEVQQLRESVNEQRIEMDDLRSLVAKPVDLDVRLSESDRS